MNLHAIASRAVAAVNPPTRATIQRSTGYTTDEDGTQVPTYASFPVRAQVQSLTFKDLQQVSGLNIQGEARALYVTGNFDGVVRPEQKGGDLVTLLDGPWKGQRWLTVQALEVWPDWCKLAVVRQVDAVPR